MAVGDSPAPVVAAEAEPLLLALGVPRAQPVPQQHIGGTGEAEKCLSQEQKYQTAPQERGEGAEEKGLSI